MSDDVIGKVAEAMFRDAWPEVDPTVFDRQAYTQHARAAVAAHTDYLLALGGVTDEDVWQAVEDWCAGEKPDPVRTLIARAVAQAVADKDAEIERLRVALVNIRHALGPDNLCSCGECDGLRVEAQAALDIARAALADEDGDA